jgi:hypothetical protein
MSRYDTSVLKEDEMEDVKEVGSLCTSILLQLSPPLDCIIKVSWMRLMRKTV